MMTATQRFKREWPWVFILLALLWFSLTADGATFGDLMRTNEVALSSELSTVSNSVTTLQGEIDSKIDDIDGSFDGTMTSAMATYGVTLSALGITVYDEDPADLDVLQLANDYIKVHDQTLGLQSRLTYGGLDLETQRVLEYSSASNMLIIGSTSPAGMVVNLKGDVQISQGDVAVDTLTLDSAIDEWTDLDTVLTNFIRQNTPITVTNDSSWTGWTTDGTLSGSNILLDQGEYLLSPVQTNGIADYTLSTYSSQNATLLTNNAVFIGKTYGSELVTNGGFDSDSGWTKEPGWGVSGGTANGTEATGFLYQSLGSIASKTMRVTYAVTNYTGGTIRFFFFGSEVALGTLRGANGTYTEDVDLPAGANGNFGLDGGTAFTGSIDDISVKEILSSGTNVVSVPYNSTGGQVMITCGPTAPGATAGLTVSNVVITGYGDLTESAQTNYVSALCRIDKEVLDCDLTRKVYVDDQIEDVETYVDDAVETYADDDEKTIRGAELRLGNMWVISPADTSGDRFIVSGGEISGDGELVGTTNEFVLAKNDYPLMSFTSDSSGLIITNFTVDATSSNVTMELFVATNGVTSEPYAEWTDDIAVGEWTRIQTYATNTYPTASAGTYELEFTVDATNTAYFRAMQQIGDSVATIHADILSIEGQVEYADSVWDDMTVSALTLSAGSGAPGLETYSGDMKQMSYDSGDSSFGQTQFSHRKKGTLAVSPHIHWSSIDDRSAITNIQFKLDALYGPIGGLLTNSYTDTVTVTGNVAFYHAIASFDSLGGGVLDESSIVMFEIECVEDGGVNNKVFIHDIDFHYQIDKPGSDNEIPD